MSRWQSSILDESSEAICCFALDICRTLTPTSDPVIHVLLILGIGTMGHSDLHDHVDVALNVVDTPFTRLWAELFAEVQLRKRRSTVDPPCVAVGIARQLVDRRIVRAQEYDLAGVWIWVDL
jgi:hypothetical protein